MTTNSSLDIDPHVQRDFNDHARLLGLLQPFFSVHPCDNREFRVITSCADPDGNGFFVREAYVRVNDDGNLWPLVRSVAIGDSEMLAARFATRH